MAWLRRMLLQYNTSDVLRIHACAFSNTRTDGISQLKAELFVFKTNSAESPNAWFDAPASRSWDNESKVSVTGDGKHLRMHHAYNKFLFLTAEQGLLCAHACVPSMFSGFPLQDPALSLLTMRAISQAAAAAVDRPRGWPHWRFRLAK